MLSEDEQIEQNEFCSKCSVKMEFTTQTFKVETDCEHLLCFKCVVKCLAPDENEIFCQACEATKKIKNEIHVQMIK